MSFPWGGRTAKAQNARKMVKFANEVESVAGFAHYESATVLASSQRPEAFHSIFTKIRQLDSPAVGSAADGKLSRTTRAFRPAKVKKPRI